MKVKISLTSMRKIRKMSSLRCRRQGGPRLAFWTRSLLRQVRELTIINSIEHRLGGISSLLRQGWVAPLSSPESSRTQFPLDSLKDLPSHRSPNKQWDPPLWKRKSHQKVVCLTLIQTTWTLQILNQLRKMLISLSISSVILRILSMGCKRRHHWIWLLRIFRKAHNKLI